MAAHRVTIVRRASTKVALGRRIARLAERANTAPPERLRVRAVRPADMRAAPAAPAVTIARAASTRAARAIPTASVAPPATTKVTRGKPHAHLHVLPESIRHRVRVLAHLAPLVVINRVRHRRPAPFVPRADMRPVPAALAVTTVPPATTKVARGKPHAHLHVLPESIRHRVRVLAHLALLVVTNRVRHRRPAPFVPRADIKAPLEAPAALNARQADTRAPAGALAAMNVHRVHGRALELLRQVRALLLPCGRHQFQRSRLRRHLQR